MTARPLRVTVVTVCYDAAATIVDTIESVAAQSHPDIEHLVIDGGSRDGTQALVRGHGTRVARFVSEPDRGVYDAMNKGIAMACGDVVGFLNADDVFEHRDTVAHIVRTMADPTLDACYADLIYVDQRDTSRIVRDWRSRDWTPGLCLTGWMPAHPTFYARRDLYARYGGFDLEFRLQSDFELMVRMFETHRIRTRYVPERWVRMRTGGMSNRSVGNVVRGNIEAYRACRKNGHPVTPLFVVRKIASRIPQFLKARLGR
ncbi:MAG: glycosyltransferase family 2 protein [Burkholderiales bacterium]|jgi:glycosyltransferase involved in cell wall biosynthesis